MRLRRYGVVAVIACLLGGLWLAGAQHGRQVAAVRTQIKMTAPKAVRHGDCLDAGAVYPLLEAVSALRKGTAYRVLSTLRMEALLGASADDGGVEPQVWSVVMPTLACRLDARVASVLARASRSDTPQESGSLAARRTAFFDRLREVRELEENLARYHALAEPVPDQGRRATGDVFAPLLRYAFAGAVPPDGVSRWDTSGGGVARWVEPPGAVDVARGAFAEGLVGASRRLRQALHREVEQGASLLAALDRGQGLASEQARRLASWLAWTEASWLHSAPQANPCEEIRQAMRVELTPLVDVYGYTTGLLTEADQFDTGHCYAPEMAALASLRQPPYGAVFMPTPPAGLQLTDGARADLEGLPALAQLGFMQVSSPRPFVCPSRSDGFRAADVSEAAAFIREYDALVSRMRLPTNGGGPPLVARVARAALIRAVDDALLRAQNHSRATASAPTAAGAVTEDEALAASSSNAATVSDSLLQILVSYRRVGEAAGARRIETCVRTVAREGLRRIEALAAASRLYEPLADPTGDRMFDLGGAAVQREALARARDRARMLASYATPFVNMLSATSSTAVDGGAAAAADYWRNTIHEIMRHEGQTVADGQVAALERFILDRLGSLTYNTCLARLATYDSPAAGNDLFSETRLRLERETQLRCRDRRESDAHETYQRLASRFNLELAGRYPFGDVSDRDAGSAGVRQFFMDYERERPALARGLEAMTGEGWRVERTFMTELEAVWSFFRGTLLASPEQTGAPVRLRLSFGLTPAGASGSERLVSWRLSSGRGTAGYPNASTTLDWWIGESLTLDLMWADRSPWVPTADPEQTDLAVDGRRATFAAGPPWALLRLIDTHRVADERGLEPDGVLLGFSVPEGGPTDGATAHGPLRVFLGLRTFSVDQASGAEVARPLPARFPRRAPLR